MGAAEDGHALMLCMFSEKPFTRKKKTEAERVRDVTLVKNRWRKQRVGYTHMQQKQTWGCGVPPPPKQILNIQQRHVLEVHDFANERCWPAVGFEPNGMHQCWPLW